MKAKIAIITFFCIVNSEHKAAVKALAWCPWQNNVLATGAGTADQTIKMWNCNNDTLIKSVNTKAQVNFLC